jgi:acyl CoA:acetate/3-ketoacid CoA transferase beta subunit
MVKGMGGAMDLVSSGNKVSAHTGCCKCHISCVLFEYFEWDRDICELFLTPLYTPCGFDTCYLYP